MKYDDRNTMKFESNGHASVQVAPATKEKTFDRSEGVSASVRKIPLISRKSRIRVGILFAIALVALVAGGLWLHKWWSVGRFIEATDDAFVGADMRRSLQGFPVSL